MIVYWSLFLVPAWAAFLEREWRRGHAFFGLLAANFLIIAFRETGGDWPAYNVMFEMMSYGSLSDALTMTDPAYGALNWLSSQLGFGIYGVNAACALFFLLAFWRFTAREARPLLMLALAVPYLIIVVVVGYTRQGTAIGFELLALIALMQRRVWRFAVWIAVAAAFHRTAAILLPLAYFAMPARGGWLGRVIVGGTVLMACLLLYAEMTSKVDQFMAAYIESDRYQSQGALIRSAMSAGAAVAFLLNWRKWGTAWYDRDIWLVFSLVALAMVPLTFVASTAADRMGLYVIPLQIIVFSRLPTLWRTPHDKQLLVAGALLLYGLALGVWLHMGQFAADLWLPYKSLLFGEVT